MYTCYRCAKIIKGKVVHYEPPLYLIRMGIDFSKAFHPKCYEAEEKEADKELRK